MSKKGSLPIRVTNVTLKLAGDDSPDSTLATGLAEVNGGLAIRIRVLKSKDGPFAKMPNFRIGEGDDARWFDYVFPTGEYGREIRNHINERVLKEYNHKLETYTDEVVVDEAETADADASDDSPFDE